MRDALRDVALLQLREIEPGGEMLAFGRQQHASHAFRRRAEKCLDAGNGAVVERVALLRPVEPQDRDVALLLDGE